MSDTVLPGMSDVFKVLETVFIGNAGQCFYRQCQAMFYRKCWTLFYRNMRLFLQESQMDFYRECQTVLQGMLETIITGNVRDSVSTGNVRQCFYGKYLTVFLQEMSENVFMWNGRHCFT